MVKRLWRFVETSPILRIGMQLKKIASLSAALAKWIPITIGGNFSNFEKATIHTVALATIINTSEVCSI